jgi:hypothetical protein
MASWLSDAHTGFDASDCQPLCAGGVIALREYDSSLSAVPAPSDLSEPLDFGDDSGEWANDGECDDRRFLGQGMAGWIGWINSGRDASDCRALYEAGSIRLWNWSAARAATQCDAIDFGDDASGEAGDGECDDLRFDGPGSAPGLTDEHIAHDASDCRQLCGFGMVALRDY